MIRSRLFWLLGLLLVLAVPFESVGAASEAPRSPIDRIVTGGDYVLRNGETERGSVVVFGGSAQVEQGALVDGDLAVFGGDVTVAGTVDGDVVVFGGGVTITRNAVIEGDCVSLGGSVTVDQGATIRGQLLDHLESHWFPFGSWTDGEWNWRRRTDGWNLPVPTPAVPSVPIIPEFSRTVIHQGPSFLGRIGGAFLSAVGVGIAVLLITLFWPQPVDQVRQVFVREPVLSGLLGFVTLLASALLTPLLLVLSAVLVLLLCVGLLGFPLIAILWLLILAAALLGWSAVGSLAGRWMAKRLSLQGGSAMMEAALGAGLVFLVLGVIGAVPWLGVGARFIRFAVTCVGLGAVVLTRFGRRDYRHAQGVMPVRAGTQPGSSSRESSREAVPLTPVVEDSRPAPLARVDNQFDAPPLDGEGPFPEQ